MTSTQLPNWLSQTISYVMKPHVKREKTNNQPRPHEALLEVRMVDKQISGQKIK